MVGDKENGGIITKTIEIKIEEELLEEVKKGIQRLGIDVSAYVKWCIRTGLYLEDINSFIRSKSRETE